MSSVRKLPLIASFSLAKNPFCLCSLSVWLRQIVRLVILCPKPTTLSQDRACDVAIGQEHEQGHYSDRRSQVVDGSRDRGYNRQKTDAGCSSCFKDPGSLQNRLTRTQGLVCGKRRQLHGGPIALPCGSSHAHQGVLSYHDFMFS